MFINSSLHSMTLTCVLNDTMIRRNPIESVQSYCIHDSLAISFNNSVIATIVYAIKTTFISFINKRNHSYVIQAASLVFH